MMKNENERRNETGREERENKCMQIEMFQSGMPKQEQKIMTENFFNPNTRRDRTGKQAGKAYEYSWRRAGRIVL